VILPRLDDPLDTDSQARWLIVAVLGPADDSRSHSRLRTSPSTTSTCVPFFSLAAARPNASQRNPALSFGLGLAFVVVLSRRPGHEDGMDVYVVTLAPLIGSVLAAAVYRGFAVPTLTAREAERALPTEQEERLRNRCSCRHSGV
jgi:hypothetical protein